MSNKFAIWLRVTPSPTTLAESSAIFKHLKSLTKGRINTFIKTSESQTTNVSDEHSTPPTTSDIDVDAEVKQPSTTYYTIFNQKPLTIQPIFEVPVYYNQQDPHYLDPFNIRGLKNRKPFPRPKTFHCQFEAADLDSLQEAEYARRENQYRGTFKVKQGEDWLGMVYRETNAPPGIAEGLGSLAEPEGEVEVEVKDGHELPSVRKDRRKREQNQQGRRKSMIPMNTLTNTWHDATGLQDENLFRKVHQDRTKRSRAESNSADGNAVAAAHDEFARRNPFFTDKNKD